MGVSYIVTRIVARLGVALWRHKLVWLLAVLSVGVLSVYQSSYAGPGSTPTGDCADTAMAAVTQVDDQAARAAYRCLVPSMRNTSEDAFVAGMHERALPRGRASRIGDQPTRDGGRIVFYLVAQQGEDVGYMVYLNAAGQVIRVE
jgi:hypothetical protein